MTLNGSSSMELAKIGGMTPDVFSRSADARLPPNILLPCRRFGYCITTAVPVDENDERNDHNCQTMIPMIAIVAVHLSGPCRAFAIAGSSAMMPAKISMRYRSRHRAA